MGQADVMEFLESYKKSKDFEKQPWLTVKEIYEKLKNTDNASQLGPITNSAKKLREYGMIKSKRMVQDEGNNRKIFYYQA